MIAGNLPEKNRVKMLHSNNWEEKEIGFAVQEALLEKY